MPNRQPPLPDIWVVTDARNDARIDAVLARLPRGSGVIFRHYHLPERERRRRFDALRRVAHSLGHLVVLSGSAAQARAWRADGAYGSPRLLSRGPALLRLVTAHSLAEMARARPARAGAILLSPVFATRSHPGGNVLGPVRFRLLAHRSPVPVIALGGLSARRARAVRWKNWAAIDGI